MDKRGKEKTKQMGWRHFLLKQILKLSCRLTRKYCSETHKGVKEKKMLNKHLCTKWGRNANECKQQKCLCQVSYTVVSLCQLFQKDRHTYKKLFFLLSFFSNILTYKSTWLSRQCRNGPQVGAKADRKWAHQTEGTTHVKLQVLTIMVLNPNRANCWS